jgi:hypothetical protein
MKKFISIFAFALLLVIQVFGQAAVDIPIYVHDNVGVDQTIYFGLDLTATDGIDPALGEYDIPPHPPTNEFQTFWNLPPFGGDLNSFRDYRAPGTPPIFPYTGTKQYSIYFQTYPSDWPITIIWDLPPDISPTSRLKDALTGGTIINYAFSGSDSLIVTNSNIKQLQVFVDFDNIIPVELTSFIATVLLNEKVVQINWSTATETNNSGFEIQKQVGSKQSAVGNWKVIGFVPGFGTTTEPKSYSFIDEDVTTGIYKYRLKQIDYDGSFEYSNVIEVEVDFTPKEFVLYQNYPNPFNPTTKIKYEIPNVGTRDRVSVRIIVYDVLGNEVATLVNEEKQPGVYEVEFDASLLSSGMYLYKLKAGTFVQTKKMILTK